MKISPARTAAFDVLLKIEREHAYSSTLLAEFEEDLSDVDRGLCHEIVLGVLRKKLVLDRYIDFLTKQKKLDVEIRVALQIGLFQIYYLDRVPDHAIVNESVGLAARAKKSSARGLVNAVLRSATRQTPILEYKDNGERIAVETSHPGWLITHWKGQLTVGSVEDLCRSNNEPPAISFRKTIRGAATKLPNDFIESSFVTGCLTATSFTSQLKDLADKWEIYFQDEASQMAAAAVDVQPTEKFLDVCASPGGKVTKLASHFLSGTRPLFIAGDLNRRRVRLLRDTCLKQGADQVQIVQYDAATALPFADKTFDRVLVDAPCTGTGTIKHNPEIRYLLGPDDFHRLQRTQLAILSNASRSVKTDGILIYSTCSLEREENEDVCRQFRSLHPEWQLVKPKVDKRFITDEGYARTYPHRDGMDGFFIATFRRF